MVILATIYAFVNHYFGLNLFQDVTADQSEITGAATRLYNFFEEQYSVFILLSIPFLALSSFLLFKNQGYRFTENLVIITFFSAQRLVVSLLMFPLQFILGIDYAGKSIVSGSISIALYCWVLLQLFRHVKSWKIILLGVASYSLGLLLFVLFFVLLLFII